jgi:hypothetical protein
VDSTRRLNSHAEERFRWLVARTPSTTTKQPRIGGLIMDNQPDLNTIMGRAQDVWTLFVALQEAGFERQEALLVMPPLIVAGAINK